MWQVQKLKHLDHYMTKGIEVEYSRNNDLLGSDNYYNYMNHGYYPPYKKLFDYH